VMVHLFLTERRQHYRLESLWKDARELSVPELLGEAKPKKAPARKPARTRSPAKKKAVARKTPLRMPAARKAAPKKKAPKKK